ncbi:antistasin-like [Physella acuta]|uniref:antistasin-like n=1 Tax=Physella acuta TaxID=109671 RepID=UPI0027DB82BA|nr:antistasin-like [Physella acuta]
MKVFIVLCVFVALGAASVINVPSKRQETVCQDECEPGSNTCPLHKWCMNIGGCHRCMFILPKRQIACPMYMCNSFCPYGHKVGADGCVTCGCNTAPVV